MWKREFLRFHHHLSDRGVMARAQTGVAFLWFLQYPLGRKLPDPSSLCIFRGRWGIGGFRRVFDQMVRVAREHGVVKDRLRLKDAAHVIANIDVPATMALLRESTESLKPEDRLATRVAQLREMLIWIDDLKPPTGAETNRLWQKVLVQRDLAHKIVEDQEHPGSPDRTISTTDTDARCGKHGDWFDGSMLDTMIDSDSEIITQINVLAANGDEAVDALTLIRMEEAAHGNDVQALSIDGAGYNGPVLRELEDPEDLNVATHVPVPAETCRACPLVGSCMGKPSKRYGRTVCMSDYQAEHHETNSYFLHQGAKPPIRAFKKWPRHAALEYARC
jgi:hypothetical protein